MPDRHMAPMPSSSHQYDHNRLAEGESVFSSEWGNCLTGKHRSTSVLMPAVTWPVRSKVAQSIGTPLSANFFLGQIVLRMPGSERTSSRRTRSWRKETHYEITVPWSAPASSSFPAWGRRSHPEALQ